MLYRAQLHHKIEVQTSRPFGNEGPSIQLPTHYDPQRMKPLRDSAREGRVNAKGIPCLYLADELNTAMSETRPWMNSYISVAHFKTVKPLQIVDCPYPEINTIQPIELLARELSPLEREDQVWRQISYAFSQPVSPTDTTAEYTPTQILAEAFRKAGWNGIRYKSLLGDGHSFALFDIDSADAIQCMLFITRTVEFKFDFQSPVVLPPCDGPGDV
jgi:hypothetical protein